MSAIAGVDPYAMRLTYGQLVDAANAKRIDDWEHTSQLLCLIHNANRDPAKGSPSRPEDWHPLRKRRRRKSTYTAARITATHDALAAKGGVRMIHVSPSQVTDDQSC